MSKQATEYKRVKVLAQLTGADKAFGAARAARINALRVIAEHECAAGGPMPKELEDSLRESLKAAYIAAGRKPNDAAPRQDLGFLRKYHVNEPVKFKDGEKETSLPFREYQKRFDNVQAANAAPKLGGTEAGTKQPAVDGKTMAQQEEAFQQFCAGCIAADLTKGNVKFWTWAAQNVAQAVSAMVEASKVDAERRRQEAKRQKAERDAQRNKADEAAAAPARVRTLRGSRIKRDDKGRQQDVVQSTQEAPRPTNVQQPPLPASAVPGAVAA